MVVIVYCLFEHLTARWASFLNDICEDDEVVVEDLESAITLEHLQDIYLEMSGLLKNCLTQY